MIFGAKLQKKTDIRKYLQTFLPINLHACDFFRTFAHYLANSSIGQIYDKDAQNHQ
jgi:hypothetical protein